MKFNVPETAHNALAGDVNVRAVVKRWPWGSLLSFVNLIELVPFQCGRYHQQHLATDHIVLPQVEIYLFGYVLCFLLTV